MFVHTPCLGYGPHRPNPHRRDPPKKRKFFPIIGKRAKKFSNHWKNRMKFSNHWKNIFQSLENGRRADGAPDCAGVGWGMRYVVL